MSVEVVLHQDDLARCGKVRVGQSLKQLSIVQRGTAVGHLDMAPAFQRREQHKQVGCAVALIFVVVPCWLSWLCRNWQAGFLDKLFRCLVQTDDGPVWIMRPVIDLQHILHAGYEVSAGFWRDDPLLL